MVKKLEEFTIKTVIVEIGENLLEEMFRVFGEICSVYDNDELIVNVATGDRYSTCAAISAAYANGLKTFEIMGEKSILLPIMKLSYYRELTDNKLEKEAVSNNKKGAKLMAAKAMIDEI